MYMSDKGRAILILLLDSSGPQTIERISDKLNMSPRSVRSYLKEVKEVLEKNGCMLINKPGVGVYAEAGESSKKELKAKLPRENELSANPALRQDYIVGTLLKNRHSYTIQLLADDLYMSKSTIIKDLEEVEKWFHKHKLSLLRKPNYGLSVEGDEFDLRKAIVFYNTRNLPKDCGDSLETCEVSGVDYRIDESVPVAKRDPDIVFISTLVGETDVRKIREAASRIFAPQNLNEEGKSVSDIIREELIIADGAFKTKEEVIA